MLLKYAPVALLALALSACGSKPLVISVGGKSTTEQAILSEIVAAQLEKQLPGIHIERKLNLGGALSAQGAMQSGAIDLYVEDIGTILGLILKEDVPADEAVGLERAGGQSQSQFRFTVLKPLGYHHQLKVVRSAEGPIKSDTLTAIANSKTAVKFGVGPDLDRKDAFMALTAQYRIGLRELPRYQMEKPALYDALKRGSLDLVAGYSTDAWIDQPGFMIVKDDRSLFQAHPVCIMVRTQSLATVPGLQKALEGLSGRFTDEAVRRMNQDVDLKHSFPSTVAQHFLAGLRP